MPLEVEAEEGPQTGFVQHWTEAGEEGQRFGRGIPPEERQVEVWRQTPGMPEEGWQGSFRAAWAGVWKRERREARMMVLGMRMVGGCAGFGRWG